VSLQTEEPIAELPADVRPRRRHLQPRPVRPHHQEGHQVHGGGRQGEPASVFLPSVCREHVTNFITPPPPRFRVPTSTMFQK
jgi:hypothetical protein